MWLLLSLTAAFSDSIKDVFSKKTSQAAGEYVASGALHLVPIFILGPLLLIIGIPEIKPMYWAGLLAIAVTNPLWSYLYSSALKEGALSELIPLLSFSSLFTALLAPLFNEPLPSLRGWSGIFLIILGAYLMNMKDNISFKSFMDPIRSIFYSSSSRKMLLVSLIWGFSSYIGKSNVLNSSPLFAAFMTTVVSFTLLFAFGKKKSSTSLADYRDHLPLILGTGVFSSILKLSVSAALAVGYTPYVMTIKRTSIMWSSIFGKAFFGETLSKKKYASIGVTFVGLILLII